MPSRARKDTIGPCCPVASAGGGDMGGAAGGAGGGAAWPGWVVAASGHPLEQRDPGIAY